MKKIIFLPLVFLISCVASTSPTPEVISTKQIIPIMPSGISIPTATPTPVAQPFPHLGMLWPDPYKQSIDQIARYDWVILNGRTDVIDPLHALNPDIFLLTSANASEVAFLPDNPGRNAYLQSIPYQWYLTQVGSILAADVDATQTTLHVNDVVVSSEKGEIKLFVPGDTALIENESVFIKSVDAADHTIVVQRGYIRPASSHKAGTRIAEHISFWPNSWVMNLSTLSPAGVADPTIGSERWSDYNARISAQSLTDPRWAGIFVDRSDSTASWLIGNSTAHTIDPDQSNRLLANYSDFDGAWEDGLRSYLDQLRVAVGPSRSIVLNWGIPHYSAVNGNNFEGIPDESWFDSWHSQIIGPLGSGSYFDWMSQARHPNLTMIETYEDNSRVDTNNPDGYSNACNSPSFIPNYRKMRFGLTTALLNDGYFSYEMNTQGHGSLCLMWFDEYDNAGQGRGYLGYPLGPARRIADQVAQNLLPVDVFDSSGKLSLWQLWSDHGYGLSAQQDMGIFAQGSDSTRIDVTETQGENWRAAFFYEPLPLTKDTDYSLFFYARADKNRTMNIWVQRDSEPWNVWLDFGKFSLTAEWQRFEITLPSLGNDAQAKLIFGMGSNTGFVWLDDLGFYKGNADIWRRDFDNGIVLVNASDEAVTIQLDATYRKINGLQDQSVNDGSLVNEVDLPPKDGLILLRNE